MSRDEAASAYLDGLLGFRGEYARFREAAERLTDDEKALLEHALSGWVRDGIENR
jgi:hypothetical protein